MASVYRVRHTDLGSAHALKVLTALDARARERLLDEGRAQATLDHPAIVRVTDTVRLGDELGLVMDLVDGPDLSAWLARHHPLTEDDALRVFRVVCEAVAAAHARGLVHRDLKPANVLMVGHGRDAVPRLTDFGIARALDRPPGPDGTRPGSVLGTPRYMAPEQMRDASTADARADVWALGCLLYELVCGRPPLAGEDDLMELYRRASSRDWPDPRALRPDLSDGVLRSIDVALQPDPGRRPSDPAVLWNPADLPAPPDATWGESFHEGDTPAPVDWLPAPQDDSLRAPGAPGLPDRLVGGLSPLALRAAEVGGTIVMPLAFLALIQFELRSIPGGMSATVGAWPWFSVRAVKHVGGGFQIDPFTLSTLILLVYAGAVELLRAIQRRRGDDDRFLAWMAYGGLGGLCVAFAAVAVTSV